MLNPVSLEFSGWRCKEKEEMKARCSVCHVFEWTLSINGPCQRKKTKKFYRKKTNFFLPKNKAPHIVIEELTNSVADGWQTLEDVLLSTDSVRAEIVWTLKSVMSGYSVRSNDDLSLTFAAMFPELKRIFNMTSTKSTYVINHGLAP